MDTISLEKYRRPGSPVDRNTTSLQSLSPSKKLPAGNSTLTDNGLMKSEREFLEFYINGQPLSEQLNSFYRIEGNILENWIGVLGWFVNAKTDIIKAKQLLGKKISDKEIRAAYPPAWSDSEFQPYQEKHQEELSDPEIIIYCCAECGDYDCGGIRIELDKTEHAFIWTITEKNKQLKFEFDKYQYFDLFDKYIRQLKNKG
jgi:hypothetical protein